MRKRVLKGFWKHLPLILLVLAAIVPTFAFGDVGNQDRYSSGGGGYSGGDGDLSGLIYFLLGLFSGDSNSITVLLIVVGIIIFYVIKNKIAKKQANDPSHINQRVNNLVNNDYTANNSAAVAAQIQAIDPAFSAEKFIGWSQEVFMKLQQAWTDRDWKPIRPFESETLFATHQQQLNEYIRMNKINVIEKIGIKHCSLKSFTSDGDKEVLVVNLNAVMRDYVIDATTRQVLESDPNRDWYMKYELTFMRKAGVKTHPGTSNKSTTNCPNCGAPTEITSAGQCAYCGSVITTGEHDWVLTNLVGTNG